MATDKQPFAEDEKRYARPLIAALEPLQSVHSFLLVVLDEGKTVTEYAEKSAFS